MRRLLYYLSWLTLITSTLFIGLLGYWLLYPYKVIEYKNLPHKVDKSVYKPGEQIILNVDFCRYLPIVPTINRSFTDGIIYNLHGSVSPTNEVGCFERKVIINVPSTLPSGEYHITSNYRFKVNPIRTIEITTVTENFKVIK